MSRFGHLTSTGLDKAHQSTAFAPLVALRTVEAIVLLVVVLTWPALLSPPVALLSMAVCAVLLYAAEAAALWALRLWEATSVDAPPVSGQCPPASLSFARRLRELTNAVNYETVMYRRIIRVNAVGGTVAVALLLIATYTHMWPLAGAGLRFISIGTGLTVAIEYGLLLIALWSRYPAVTLAVSWLATLRLAGPAVWAWYQITLSLKIAPEPSSKWIQAGVPTILLSWMAVATALVPLVAILVGKYWPPKGGRVPDIRPKVLPPYRLWYSIAVAVGLAVAGYAYSSLYSSLVLTVLVAMLCAQAAMFLVCKKVTHLVARVSPTSQAARFLRLTNVLWGIVLPAGLALTILSLPGDQFGPSVDKYLIRWISIGSAYIICTWCAYASGLVLATEVRPRSVTGAAYAAPALAIIGMGLICASYSRAATFERNNYLWQAAIALVLACAATTFVDRKLRSYGRQTRERVNGLQNRGKINETSVLALGALPLEIDVKSTKGYLPWVEQNAKGATNKVTVESAVSNLCRAALTVSEHGTICVTFRGLSYEACPPSIK